MMIMMMMMMMMMMMFMVVITISTDNREEVVKPNIVYNSASINIILSRQ